MTKDSQTRSVEKARAFVQRVFGFRQLRPGQEEILQSLLDGLDTLVIMPTGGGKSLCYQVPAFLGRGIALVISPLISLMKDQVDSLRVLDLPAAAIHSLMGVKAQEETLSMIGKGAVKLLYVSPERLRNKRFMEVLEGATISFVAVDEAHCISQWGHDFRPDYLRINESLEALGRPQTAAFTATATEKVRSDIIEQLKLRAPKVYVTGFDRRNLFWEVVSTKGEKEKTALLEERLARLSGAAIVYTGTRKGVKRIVGKLRRAALSVEGYHAGMEDAERIRVQEAFMEGRTDLVVATNAFGMGIDRPDIRMVIHHTFPGSIEAYYQESGRAGRDGEGATCLLLYALADRQLQEFFIEARYPPREVVYDIYDRLRKRPEDLVWLTYKEIARMGKEEVSEMAVASCIKILEDAGVLRRLHRYDNQAELFLRKPVHTLLAALPSRARVRKRLLLALEGLYGEDRLMEGIRFLPQDLANQADLSLDALRRSFAQMGARREITYMPPFRGRGVQVLERVSSEALRIDFQALQVRKAHELSKLDRIMAYASSEGCRRRFLLGYFGEELEGATCGACDLCQEAEDHGPGLSEDRADPVVTRKILSGIARLKGRFGLSMAVKVLTGSKDAMLFQFRLHRLSTYGLMSEYTQGQIRSWIKELMHKGCVVSRRAVMGEKSYPILELSDRGRRVMAGRETLPLSLPLSDRWAPAADMPLGQVEPAVFSRLRQLRAGLAREEGLPPYCIFQDRTLREMAGKLPKTPDELLAVTGVGEVTLRKYGKAFLELLLKIRDEGDA